MFRAALLIACCWALTTAAPGALISAIKLLRFQEALNRE